MNFHQILALGKLADYTFGNNLCSLQGECKLFCTFPICTTCTCFPGFVMYMVTSPPQNLWSVRIIVFIDISSMIGNVNSSFFGVTGGAEAGAAGHQRARTSSNAWLERRPRRAPSGHTLRARTLGPQTVQDRNSPVGQELHPHAGALLFDI